MSKFMAIVVTAASLLAADAAFAKGKSGGSQSGGNSGNRSFSFKSLSSNHSNLSSSISNSNKSSQFKVNGSFFNNNNNNNVSKKLTFPSNSQFKVNNFVKDNNKFNTLFNNNSNKKIDNFVKDNNKFENFVKNNNKVKGLFLDNNKFDNFLKNKKKCDHDGCWKPWFDYHCQDYYRCCYPRYGCIRTVCVDPLIVGQGYEPFHSTYICMPGDSFYTVSLKEYGTSSNSRYIAQFNRLAVNSPLTPGQTLMLPAIASNGSLSMSRSPAADAVYSGQFPTAYMNVGATSQPLTTPSQFATPNRFTPPTQFAAPTEFTSTTPATESPAEPPRSKVTVGSTLLVDGQTFGDKAGVARLRVSGLSMPIEVLEWTNGAVKIRLPQVELTSATNADIELVRADGNVASKTGIELSAATVQVALDKK
jgi:hypothetical protein